MGDCRRAGERRARPHLAHGRHDGWASRMDRRVPDFIGGISGHVAFYVHHSGGPAGPNVARCSAGVFFFLIDPDYVRSDLLRPAEIRDGKNRKSYWRITD